MVIKNVTDLDVYQESLRILPLVYQFLEKIPKAEGFAKRNSSKEFRRYLLIAIGSSDEIVTHLKVISIDIPTLSDEANPLINQYIVISKRLNSLHKKWDIKNLRQRAR